MPCLINFRIRLLGPYVPPEGQRWQAGQDEIHRLHADGYLEFREATPFLRYFEDEEGAEHDPFYCFMEVEWSGTSEAGKNIVNGLLGESHGFDTVKPVRLLQTLIQAIASSPNDLILDFFAGSGTTGHAIWSQAASDDIERRFLLVQLPEILQTETKEQKTAADFCDSLGVSRTIAELTKERLRRAGVKVASENPEKTIDTGFRVYKLATSNLKPWQPDPKNLAQSLLDAVDNILPGRTEDDLLVELLLKTGIDLTLPMATRTICQRPVHALGGGVLIVYLSDVSDADAENLGQGIADWHAELDPIRATTFYFRDSGFASAAAKANVAAIIRQRVGNRVEKLASI